MLGVLIFCHMTNISHASKYFFLGWKTFNMTVQCLQQNNPIHKQNEDPLKWMCKNKTFSVVNISAYITIKPFYYHHISLPSVKHVILFSGREPPISFNTSSVTLENFFQFTSLLSGGAIGIFTSCKCQARLPLATQRPSNALQVSWNVFRDSLFLCRLSMQLLWGYEA